jgi:hypothetical protein
MTGRATVSRARTIQLASGATLVALSLVLAHDLVYLARFGSAYGEALVHSGHGLGWSRAVAVVVALGVALAVAAGVQLLRLGRKASRAGEPHQAHLETRVLATLWLQTAWWLAAATLVLLTIQENAERSMIGLPAPGLALLATPEYAWGWAIAIAVAGVVAFVAALLRWRREMLLARIRAARSVHVRAATPLRRPGLGHAIRPRHLGRVHGLRAPPTTRLARTALA